MGAQNAKADLEEYRAGYPNARDNTRLTENLRFYKGEISSSPSGDFIDNIHNDWKGNYALLERHHGYIQWLFPIREHGMNMQSQVLQLHEAEAIRSIPECQERLLRSYEMMLDFYGMKLKDRSTGELERSKNFKERYRNLNRSSHNYLRITRILKCLGEMGFEHLKFSFLAFVAEEIWVHGELKNCASSLEHYWSGTLRDDTQRAQIEKKIQDFKDAGRLKRAGQPNQAYDDYPYRSARRRANSGGEPKAKHPEHEDGLPSGVEEKEEITPRAKEGQQCSEQANDLVGSQEKSDNECEAGSENTPALPAQPEEHSKQANHAPNEQEAAQVKQPPPDVPPNVLEIN